MILPVSLSEDGAVKYDAIAKQGHRPGKTVFSQYKDLVPIAAKETEESLARPDPETEAQITERTKKALNALVDEKTAAVTKANSIEKAGEPQYIRYTPSAHGPGHNSGAAQRVIRMVEAPVDPMEPPKFKHKRLVKGPPSPPAPVLHSPPRKLTVKDMQNWKIPPCVSNWKNAKGYTIPLDKRLAADGRGLQDPHINDNFAKLSEALYIAERNAREEIEKRAMIRRKLLLKEKAAKEEELRLLAEKARLEREAADREIATAKGDDMEALREREAVREERKRERERDRRLENAGKKTKMMRDRERDVSEKIALGQMPRQMTAEALYDQRLFNQSEGMESGFGDDEAYNIFDKPLFQGSSANQLYRPKKGGDEEVYGGDVQNVLKTARFKPDKDFSGVDRSQPAQAHSGPVQFEKEEEDPFGLDAFLQEAKRGSALDAIGTRGGMAAAAGGTMDTTSNRTKVDFRRGQQ